MKGILILDPFKNRTTFQNLNTKILFFFLKKKFLGG